MAATPAACQSYSVVGLERRKTGWLLSSHCLFWSLARGMCTTRGLRGEGLSKPCVHGVSVTQYNGLGDLFL